MTYNQCMICKHSVFPSNSKGIFACPAFPKGIPKELLSAGSAEMSDEAIKEATLEYGIIPFPHNKKHPEQVGDYLFEPIKTQS